MNCQMMRVISSPSSSTTVPRTLILDMLPPPLTIPWSQDIPTALRDWRRPRPPLGFPQWLASVSALRQRTIAGLADAVPIDANDRVTVAAATDEFTVDEHIRATG